MARYIDADKLFRYVDEQTHLSKGKLQNYIRENVAADVVEVKHGHWITDENGIVICSECGEEHAWDEYRATYCEDCGVKMDGRSNT